MSAECGALCKHVRHCVSVLPGHLAYSVLADLLLTHRSHSGHDHMDRTLHGDTRFGRLDTVVFDGRTERHDVSSRHFWRYSFHLRHRVIGVGCSFVNSMPWLNAAWIYSASRLRLCLPHPACRGAKRRPVFLRRVTLPLFLAISLVMVDRLLLQLTRPARLPAPRPLPCHICCGASSEGRPDVAQSARLLLLNLAMPLR